MSVNQANLEKGVKHKKSKTKVARHWFIIAIIISIILALVSALIILIWDEFGEEYEGKKAYVLIYAVADALIRVSLIMIACQRHGLSFALVNIPGFILGREDHYLLFHYKTRNRRMIRDALKIKAVLACFSVCGMIGWVFAIKASINIQNSNLMYISYAGAILAGLYLLLNIFVFKCYKSIRYTVRINGRVVRGGGRIHLIVIDDDDDDDDCDGDDDGDDNDDGDDGDDCDDGCDGGEQ